MRPGDGAGPGTGADTASEVDSGGGSPPPGRYAGESTLGELGTITLTTTSEAESLGTADAPAGDVDGDGQDDLIVGVWDKDTSEARTGAAYLLRGPVTTDRDLADADAWFEPPSPNACVGRSVAGAGDLDADGFDDVLVGGPGWTEVGAAGGGAVWVLGGPVAGELRAATATARITGSEVEDELGHAVAGVGDVDGDGTPDVLAGAPGAGVSGDAPGAAYLFRGPLVGEVEAGAAHARLFGAADGDRAGTALAGAGDLDGDGLADLVVGAPYHDGAGASAGLVAVLLGPVSGDQDIADADAVFAGEAEAAQAGSSVAGGGDVDGDGRDDVLVGAPGGDMACLLLGPPTSGTTLAGAAAQFTGQSETSAGAAVALAGDLDQDGHADVVIGAPVACDWAERGPAVFLLYGPITGRRTHADANATWACSEDRGRAGAALAAGGDLDGDDRPDFLVGAPQATYPSRPSGLFVVLSSLAP